jgi:UDP:flavonoid glycosyltransferase YjiC (YdhE family)
MQARNKPVVLLVAEAVTLAHFARIVTLAKALDPDRYEVVVASDPRYFNLETPLGCAFHPIRSIPSAEFAQALAKGQPLYSVETLTRYVEDDLELLDRVQPDLVIGDFRLSLAVSAPLRHIPYAAVVNAYWSPYADIKYPVPDLPMTRILGVALGQKLFDLVRPVAFAMHARPLNRVRANSACRRWARICGMSIPGATTPSMPTSPNWCRPVIATQSSLPRSGSVVDQNSAAAMVERLAGRQAGGIPDPRQFGPG